MLGESAFVMRALCAYGVCAHVLYVPRPQEPSSLSSNKGSTLIAGCIWCFVVSVPEARFAGAEGHPVALASLEISSRCCSCWSVLSLPSFPLFPP